MQDPARESFLDVSRRLNDEIRALAAALKQGEVPQDTVDAARRIAALGLSRLRALGQGGESQGAALAKVIQHLDLFAETAGSVGTAPALAGKLLDHLLEEQVEITEAAAGGKSALPRSAVAPVSSAAASKETSLPGGRRPLSVGSLIGR